MSQELIERVDFDLIRYANCWEDADLLLKGLQATPGARMLSIGSAGDNSFSLLVTDPELVVAVDVNAVQLALIELKKAAICGLEYDDVLAFLGFRPCADRLALYRKIRERLPEEDQVYWDVQTEAIINGVIHQGKFEGYFQLFARKVLPWIHRKSRVEALLSPKSEPEQRHFYEKKWNTWRWRLLFKIFFSKTVMGRYGRDPEFLKEVRVPVGKTIYSKAGAHLQQVAAQTNPMLRYSLTGSFGDLLPHYLQPENFLLIRERMDRLKTLKGYAQDAIATYGQFRYMNLSNIFEYMSTELFQETATQLAEGLEKGGRLAYWNLMVPRHLSTVAPDKLKELQPLSSQLTSEDKGFFYHCFLIDERI